MSSEIFVTWAMPVSSAQLGARLMSYVDTKAAITTFRLATRHTAITACHNLPEEVILMIAGKVRDISFEDEITKWNKISNCLADTCTTMSHIQRTEIRDAILVGRLPADKMKDEDWLADEFAEEANEAHQEFVKDQCNYLMSAKGKLGRCKRIFTRDFGILPYFTICESYDCDVSQSDMIINDVEAKSYLMLPPLRAPISSGPAAGYASFSVGSVLDRSVLAGPTEVQLQQFRTAVNILNLHPYNPDEDESVFEDKPIARDASRPGRNVDSEDTNREGLKDSDNDHDGSGSDPVASDEATVQGSGPARGVDSDIKTGKENGSLDAHVSVSLGQVSHHSYPREGKNGMACRDAQSKQEETWPQLMILGCGILECMGPF